MPNQNTVLSSLWTAAFRRPARAALARLSKLDSLQELYAIFEICFRNGCLVRPRREPLAEKEFARAGYLLAFVCRS